MILSQDVQDEDDDNELTRGKVQKAFSRRRGFTRKRKKERRKAMENADAEYD